MTCQGQIFLVHTQPAVGLGRPCAVLKTPAVMLDSSLWADLCSLAGLARQSQSLGGMPSSEPEPCATPCSGLYGALLVLVCLLCIMG